MDEGAAIKVNDYLRSRGKNAHRPKAFAIKSTRRVREKNGREILKINVALRPTHSSPRTVGKTHTKHLRKYNCGIMEIREGGRKKY